MNHTKRKIHARQRSPCHGKEAGSREAGSGTVLVGAVIMVGAVVAFIAIVVVSYVMAHRRAAEVADLVAISAAAQYAAAADPCQAARRIAVDNDVSLTECTVAGDAWDFVVSVTVETPAGLPGLPRTVAVTAHAGRLSGDP